MPVPARGPALRAIVVLGTLTLMLAGCSFGDGSAREQPPRVAACYDLTVRPEVDATSLGRPPVDCAAPHTMQVFAVTQLGGDLAAWSGRPSTQALRRAAADQHSCTGSALRGFLEASEQDRIRDLVIRSYFPPRSGWLTGERRVTCVFSLPGSSGAPAIVEGDARGARHVWAAPPGD